jgi:hypothetical protein
MNMTTHHRHMARINGWSAENAYLQRFSQPKYSQVSHRPRLGVGAAVRVLTLGKEICAVFVMCHLIGWHALRCG